MKKVAEVENELKKNMIDNSAQPQTDNESTSNEISNSPKPMTKSYSSNMFNISQHLENFVDGISKTAKNQNISKSFQNLEYEELKEKCIELQKLNNTYQEMTEKYKNDQLKAVEENAILKKQIAIKDKNYGILKAKAKEKIINLHREIKELKEKNDISLGQDDMTETYSDITTSQGNLNIVSQENITLLQKKLVELQNEISALQQ